MQQLFIALWDNEDTRNYELAQMVMDGRYAFVEVSVEVDATVTPRAEDPADLVAKAQRDCFVGASMTIEPDYTWRVS